MPGEGEMASQLTKGRFTLEIRRKFFPVRVVRSWPRMPREAPISWSVQGQVGATWCSKGHSWGVGKWWVLRFTPSQNSQWFFDFMKGKSSVFWSCETRNLSVLCPPAGLMQWLYELHPPRTLHWRGTELDRNVLKLSDIRGFACLGCLCNAHGTVCFLPATGARGDISFPINFRQ